MGMVERILRVSALLLIGCFLLPGCGYMTKSGRQQMAYQRYVNKSIHRRNKGRQKITKAQQRVPDFQPTKYEVHSGLVGSPESVTTEPPPEQ
jgi:uncharacterized C2H2 Zn-finger protein